jgi:hypothetical protein
MRKGLVYSAIGGLMLAAPLAEAQVVPRLFTLLTGIEQVPSITSPASGAFAATLDPARQTLSFSLSYSGLSSAVQFAHIHLGERFTNGGIMAFLCGGGGKPACPQSGTVTGTVSASDIVALPAQGVPAGGFAQFAQGVLAKAAYVNVHTATFPDGEIRGQIKVQ